MTRRVSTTFPRSAWERDKRNPTLKQIYQQCGCFSEEHWDEYLNHIKKKFPDEIRSWAESSDKNMKKAHAALTKTWEPDYDKFS